MQNDLISRSALMQDIIKRFGCKPYIEVGNHCEYIHEIINEQPTAYDVEKVVAELEELKIKRSDDSVYGIGVLNGYAEAIDYIRRNGGKE